MTTNQVPGTQTVVPPNVFQIRSKNDLITLLYWIVPLTSAALVSYGVVQDSDATLWAGVVTGALQLVLQFARTQDYARKAIYTVLNLANTVLIAYVAGWNPDALTHVMPILTLILGGAPAALATQNVNNSGDEGREFYVGEHRAGE
ncbi:hypothetical protein TIN2_27 [Tsukamurella phage TIN2]|uniref:Holin n=1 Tax=Tsukamurella phage TIN2 TaxID=1636545 RepID=A0A0K0N5N3_9CAUD|nr:holin [Tsukamurella phage TIN2]AKJ71717.1 hypothetical protein TIN2_27 [Tsukamurella phage TIN2]